MKPIIDLKGQKFGKLLVTKYIGRKKNRTLWECICDCGKTTIKARGDLKAGHTKSCGCIFTKMTKNGIITPPHKETCTICGKEYTSTSSFPQKYCGDSCRNTAHNTAAKTNTYKTLQSYMNRLVSIVKHRAKKNNLNHDITTNKIMQRMEQQKNKCCKTGIPFELGNSDTTRVKSPWSPSIDKINPNKGYTMDNIQITCIMYNFCKNKWTHKDVLLFAQKVRDYE